MYIYIYLYVYLYVYLYICPFASCLVLPCARAREVTFFTMQFIEAKSTTCKIASLEWMSSEARAIEAATGLSHSGRVAAPVTQPLSHSATTTPPPKPPNPNPKPKGNITHWATQSLYQSGCSDNFRQHALNLIDPAVQGNMQKLQQLQSLEKEVWV